MEQPVITPTISKDKKYRDKMKNDPVWVEKQKKKKLECYYRHHEDYKAKNRERERARYVRKTPQPVQPVPPEENPPAVGLTEA